MPASALKKLKASLHEQRTSKQPRPKQGQQRATQRETPAQKANRLRRDTLLPELQRRNKVGGILDRRIGENDPTLAPEDRMLKRFLAENRRSKKAQAFNLEDDDDEDEQALTHLGRPLANDSYHGPPINEDNFDDRESLGSDGSGQDGLLSRSKRRLEDAIDDLTKNNADAEDDQPARKKSKKEVMEEVIAKSKFHKHERQQVQEQDEAMREQLDQELPGLLELLGGKSVQSRSQAQTVLSDTAKFPGPQPGDTLADGRKYTSMDQQYDQRLRQMALDKRAQPTDRTRTVEEKAEDDARRLRDLEEQRQRRMRGDPELDHEAGEEDDGADENGSEPGADGVDDSAAFGFADSKSSLPKNARPEFDFEDEDDFIIDEDLVADASDVDGESVSESSEPSDANELKDPGDDNDDADDADFLHDVLPENENVGPKTPADPATKTEHKPLAYTYPCPKNHSELLQVFKNVALSDTPTVVQRIRALYHPSLDAGNKTKLGAFGASIVDHIAYLPEQESTASLAVIESLTRHLHSMSHALPIDIAKAFRRHIERIDNLISPGPQSTLSAGDLALLTAVGSIYPTSDHFHQVVTPAITTIAHWLEALTLRAQAAALSDHDSRAGAYLTALSARYQALSRRYIPEAVGFTAHALAAPRAAAATPTHIANLERLADLWHDSAAFPEIFAPGATSALKRAGADGPLRARVRDARRRRRPLELHHHRPLAIKTALPQFEAGFHPGKHYDADRERAEAARLRKEHRREAKAAARELRRDAEFVGREKLAARKAADRAYEDKFRRIIGGIGREEGAEKKAYEREKARRKGRRF